MKPSREKVTMFETDTHVEVIQVLGLDNEPPIALQVADKLKAKSASDIPTAIQRSFVTKEVKDVKHKQTESLNKKAVPVPTTKEVASEAVKVAVEPLPFKKPTSVAVENTMEAVAPKTRSYGVFASTNDSKLQVESPVEAVASNKRPVFASINDSKLQVERERLKLKETLAVVKIKSNIPNEDTELRYTMRKGCIFEDILTAKEIYVVIDRILETRVVANDAGGKMKIVDSRELIQLLDSEPDKDDSKGFKVHENAFMLIERKQVDTKLDEVDENATEKLVKRDERLQLLCDSGQGDNDISQSSSKTHSLVSVQMPEKEQEIVIVQGKPDQAMVQDPVKIDTKVEEQVIEQKNKLLIVEKKPTEVIKVSTTQQAFSNKTTDLDKGDLSSKAAKPEENVAGLSKRTVEVSEETVSNKKAPDATVKTETENMPQGATAADDSFSTCLTVAPEVTSLHEIYHMDVTELVIQKLKNAGLDSDNEDL